MIYMAGSISSGNRYDVIIIGGGIIGSSIAYFLKSCTDFRGSVLVIEKSPAYFESSTALSVGGIRQQFSVPENIEISRFGIDFVRNYRDYLSVEGECPDISFVENGYLFLATESGYDILHQNYKLQKKHEVKVDFLGPVDLRSRFPWLSVYDISAATFGYKDEGWLDPYSLLRAFKNKAVSLGAEYIKDEAVLMSHKSGKLESVTTAGGDTYYCGFVINAAGARAAGVALLAGIDDLPVHSRKRMVYVFRSKEDIGSCPLVIDPTGVYFRSEGKNYLCGMSPPADQDFDCDDLEVDNHWFDDVIWPVLARRVEAFDAIRRENSWAGHYAYNTLDQNAILGPHPELSNFFFANGFSGHGLQQAPAVGRGIAELIVRGRYQTLDLSRLSFERFRKTELVKEINVV